MQTLYQAARLLIFGATDRLLPQESTDSISISASFFACMGGLLKVTLSFLGVRAHWVEWKYSWIPQAVGSFFYSEGQLISQGQGILYFPYQSPLTPLPVFRRCPTCHSSCFPSSCYYLWPFLGTHSSQEACCLCQVLHDDFCRQVDFLFILLLGIFPGFSFINSYSSFRHWL